MTLNGLGTYGNGLLGVDHAEYGDMLVQVGPMDANPVAEKLPAVALAGRGFGEDGKKEKGHGMTGTVGEHHSELTIRDLHRQGSEVL
jgi:hypothetical protein